MKSSVVVVPRDRFSPTLKCLETLLAHTPPDLMDDLIVVMGGAPARLENELRRRYADGARLIFETRFLNPAESRNIGLRAARNTLAAIVDNDVFVRPGWLEALLGCQKETGAAMVAPLMLEPGNLIHTAGNDFYTNYTDGRAHLHKVLRYMKKPYTGRSDLKRVPTDYGELHCQLVHVKTALDLGVFDEKIREVGECDSGLTWKKAGCAMWFEPASVIMYDKPSRITDPGDVRFFVWRWDMRGILEGYNYFKNKWGMDVQGEGSFKYFLADFNNIVGLLARTWPCRLTLWIDHRLKDLKRALMNSLKVWGRLKAWRIGFRKWA